MIPLVAYGQSHLTFDWMPILIALVILIGLAYIFLIPFCVAHAAKTKGRSATGWFFLSILINPFFAMILLLIMGDTDAKRQQRILEDERLRNTVRPRPTTPPTNDAAPQPDHSRYMPH